MRAALLLALALWGCSSGDPPQPAPAPQVGAAPASYMDASAWEIGPVIDGINYSHSVPLHPAQSGAQWYIDFPNRDGVHYVTAGTGPLSPTQTITLKYRIDLDPGAKFVASSQPTAEGLGPTLYFEKCNDDWGSDGNRWWATAYTPVPIVAGEHTLTVPLSKGWTSVLTMSEANNPQVFAATAADACEIGFTFGGGTGYGHGVFVVGGAARITVESFTVK